MIPPNKKRIQTHKQKIPNRPTTRKKAWTIWEANKCHFEKERQRSLLTNKIQTLKHLLKKEYSETQRHKCLSVAEMLKLQLKSIQRTNNCARIRKKIQNKKINITVEKRTKETDHKT